MRRLTGKLVSNLEMVFSKLYRKSSIFIIFGYIVLWGIYNKMGMDEKGITLDRRVTLIGLFLSIGSIYYTLRVKETQDREEYEREKPDYQLLDTRNLYRVEKEEDFIDETVGIFGVIKSPKVRVQNFSSYGGRTIEVSYVLGVDDECLKETVSEINKKNKGINIEYEDEGKAHIQGGMRNYTYNIGDFGKMEGRARERLNQIIDEKGKYHEFGIPINFRLMWWISSLKRELGIKGKGESINNQDKETGIIKEDNNLTDKMAVDLYRNSVEEQANKFVDSINNMERLSKSYVIITYKDIKGEIKNDIFGIKGVYKKQESEGKNEVELVTFMIKEKEFISTSGVKDYLSGFRDSVNVYTSGIELKQEETD